MSAAFNAGGIIYRAAQLADDADLKNLLRENAMPSWVALSLEREPCFFAGEGLMGEPITVIARAESSEQCPVGMYSTVFLTVHVNGKPQRAGYLGGLRVNPHYRHRIRVLKNGFASVRALARPNADVTCWFTSVASENSPARRLLEAGLAGMPKYSDVGTFETLAFSAIQGKSKGLLQQATLRDVPSLAHFFNHRAAAYQFAPVLTEQWLLGLSPAKGLTLQDFWLLKDDAGTVRGCMAVWDQRAFKQTVARGYRFPLNLLRSPYNLWARAAGRVKLPAPGVALEQAYLAFIAFDEQADGVAVDAVREGLVKVREKGAVAGILGVAAANPLAKKLKSALCPHSYRTCIETVSWLHRLPPALDGRPPQPEVAIL